jgi:hypothetical protein
MCIYCEIKKIPGRVLKRKSPTNSFVVVESTCWRY